MTVAQVAKFNRFSRKEKVTSFLYLKSAIKTCLVSIWRGAWVCIFWAVGLDTCCVNGKGIYSWWELPVFMNLGNNIHKVEQLIIENSCLPHLGKEILSFDCHFKADIMAIWQYENLQ